MFKSEIPIQNIFYILSYAWDFASFDGYIKRSTEKSPDLLNLATTMYINALDLILKRGLKTEYVTKSEESTTIKGKINFTSSAKQIALRKRSLNCEFDELEVDHKINQILYSMAHSLLRKDIAKESRIELKKVIVRFPKIDLINFTSEDLNRCLGRRNDKIYFIALNICKLLHLINMPSANQGKAFFADILDSNSLPKIFETFLFRFYASKFKTNNTFKVTHNKEIKSSLSPVDELSGSLLPSMEYDILLENSELRIVIDAKFYKGTFQTYHGSKKLKSGNIYQIEGYVNHLQRFDIMKRKYRGILIYPVVTESIHAKYLLLNEHSIEAFTINLNQENWEQIERDLLNLITV